MFAEVEKVSFVTRVGEVCEKKRLKFEKSGKV